MHSRKQETFLHIDFIGEPARGSPSYRTLAQFSCIKKSPLLILISQGENPPQFSLSFHLKLNALDVHGKPQSADVTVALTSFSSLSTFFCIPPVPFACCPSDEPEREEGLPGVSLAHYLCISVIKR